MSRVVSNSGRVAQGKQHVSHELRTEFRLGGPIGDYIGFWRGPIKGYTTNLIQYSHGEGRASGAQP